MSPAEWVETLGAVTVFIGGAIEGEAVFIAAGYAVSQGLLAWKSTFLLAVLGGTLGDHLFYLLGRLYGASLIRSFPWLRRLRAHATVLLRRWGRGAAFLMRFAYGLRMVLPLTMGATRFPVRFFLPFNILGAVAFASVYLSLGYFFGEVAEEALARLGALRLWIPVLILALGALAWIAREWLLLRRAPADGAADPRR